MALGCAPPPRLHRIRDQWAVYFHAILIMQWRVERFQFAVNADTMVDISISGASRNMPLALIA